MFFTRPQNEHTEVEGIQVVFSYPTVADEIKIEAKKQVLSMGQYGFLNLSPMDLATQALDVTDAISTLSVCVKFPNNPELNLELLCDEEGRKFILDCHKKFNDWRLSFRKTNEGNAGGQKESKSDSK